MSMDHYAFTVLEPNGNSKPCEQCGEHVGCYQTSGEECQDLCPHCYGDPHDDEPCRALPRSFKVTELTTEQVHALVRKMQRDDPELQALYRALGIEVPESIQDRVARLLDDLRH